MTFRPITFVGNTFVLQNAGVIETRGLEVDVVALPACVAETSGPVLRMSMQNMTIFPTAACARTPWGMEPDAGQPGFPTVCDASGNQVGGTPKWTAYGSFRTERTVSDGSTLYGQFDINWRDDIPSGIDSSGDPNHVADSVTLANLHIGYRFGGDRYDIVVVGLRTSSISSTTQ